MDFVELGGPLVESRVLSVHLLLKDEAREFLPAERLVRLRHAVLDVFEVKPPPQADHKLVALPNVTLSTCSAFRTPKASGNLIKAALNHCRCIAGG
jgi:D-3-phosphoglycerate dehydrogenase